jgi:hypothetical protein
MLNRMWSSLRIAAARAAGPSQPAAPSSRRSAAAIRSTIARARARLGSGNQRATNIRPTSSPRSRSTSARQRCQRGRIARAPRTTRCAKSNTSPSSADGSTVASARAAW